MDMSEEDVHAEQQLEAGLHMRQQLLVDRQDELLAQQVDFLSASSRNPPAASLRRPAAPVAATRTTASVPAASNQAMNGPSPTFTSSTVPSTSSGPGVPGSSAGLRRELLAASEEELLKQQRDFLSKQSVPSAKVTRVTRKPQGEKPAPPAAVKEREEGMWEDQPTNIPGQEIPQVLHEVVERTPKAAAIPPAYPSEPGTPVPAFPEAVHRKISKFALGRKSRGTSSSAPGPSMQSAPQPPQPIKDVIGLIQDPEVARATTTSTTDDASEQGRDVTDRPTRMTLVTRPSADAGDPSVPPLRSILTSQSGQDSAAKTRRRVTFSNDVQEEAGGDVERERKDGQQASIDQQNRQQLAAMTEEERREALMELKDRLPQTLLDFLRRRGQHKLQQTDAPSTELEPSGWSREDFLEPKTPYPRSRAGSSDDWDMSDDETFTNEAMGTGSTDKEEALTDRATANAAMTTAEAMTNAAPNTAASTGGGCIVAKRAPEPKLCFLHQDESARGQQEGSVPMDERLVAHVRFGLDGCAVGVQQATDVPLEDQVVLRDALRQDEGIIPTEGYTLLELVMLARSSMSSQRAAALKLLTVLLAQAKPSMADLDEGGALRPRPVSPPQFYQERFSLDWSSVWQYLVSEVGVATTVRLALDDTLSTVVTAASEALLALVGPGAAEELIGEVADAMPLTGWPKVRLVQLKRAHALGLWDCALDTSLRVMQDMETDKRAPTAPWSDQDQSPEELAGMDPLAGLVQMGLLPRIRHIVQNQTAPSALPSLLCVLVHMASASSLAAEVIAGYPGMLEGVQQVAESYPTGANVRSCTQHARLCAIRLVRTLCQSSKAAARMTHAAGLLQYPRRVLMLANTEDSIDQLLMQLEAMRTWRAATQQGIPIMHMDHMYPCIAQKMIPPAKDSALGALADGVKQLQQLRCEGVRWLLAAEGHLLLEALLMHAACIQAGDRSIGGEMVGSGGAAALVTEAREILSGATIQRIEALHACSAAHLLSSHVQYRGFIPLLHPVLVMPVAAAAACCLATVAHLLTTYWRTYMPVFASPQAFQRSGLNLQAIGLSHVQIHPNAPMVPAGSEFPQPAPTGESPGGGRALGERLLCRLLVVVASGQATRVEPLSLVPCTARAVSQTAAAGVLQSVLMLLQAQHPALPERWAATGGLLLPILQHVKLDASQRPYCIKTAEPWALGHMQSRLPVLALLATTVKALHDCWQLVTREGEGEGEGSGLVQLHEAQLSCACVDAMAATVALAPPGHEASCLRVLSSSLSAPVLQPLLTAADTVLTQFATLPGPLQLAAAGGLLHPRSLSHQPSPSDLHEIGGGGRDDYSVQDYQLGRGAVVFPRPEQPDPHILSRYLMHSYAASWLSFLSIDDNPPKADSQAQTAATVLAVSPQLPSSYADSPAGSRLPAPAYWMLTEAHALPAHVSALLRGQQPQAGPSTQEKGRGTVAGSGTKEGKRDTVPGPGTKEGERHTVAGPGTRERGRDTASGPGIQERERHTVAGPSNPTSSSVTGSSTPVSEESESVNVVGAVLLVCLGMEACGSLHLCGLPHSLKMQCVLQLSYIFDPLELLPPDLKPSLYASWTDPNVRWPLAALTHYLLHGSFTAAAATSPITTQPTTSSSKSSPRAEPPTSIPPAALITTSSPLAALDTISSSLSAVNTVSSSTAAVLAMSSPLAAVNATSFTSLAPSWASSSLVDQMSDIFISSSNLDPLFGVHMALLLLPSTQSSRAARRTWSLLASEGVLHLLPRIEECPGGVSLFSAEFQDDTMLELLVRSVSAGDVDKAAELHALPAFLATRSIAASLLAGAAAADRVVLLRVESRLRSLLRGASLELLQQLFAELKLRCTDRDPQFLESFVTKAVAVDPDLVETVCEML